MSSTQRTLAAGLRVALARGLNGFADQVRSRIAARGSDEGAGLTGDVPPEAALSDFSARFVRQRPLGAGAFAKVTRAYDLELGVEVAIKRSSLKEIFDPGKRGELLEAARTEASRHGAAQSRVQPARDGNLGRLDGRVSELRRRVS